MDSDKHMIIVIQAALLCLIGCAVLFYMVCTVLTYRFFARQRDMPEPGLAVSVLIPICGVDEGSLENWASFCRQNYPNYEVLFGVMDQDDAAVPVLQDLVAQFTHRARLFCGLPPLGLNHQISNLIHLLARARHDVIVLADSDIRVGPTYLRDVTSLLDDPVVGVVTCGYLDRHPNSLGAALAAFGRGIEFIPSVLVARSLNRGLHFAIGPTIATRREVLAKIGGLQGVLNRIGSDYHIGRRAAAAGYRVELSPYVLCNDCGGESVWNVVRRELRWARTIRLNHGLQYYGIGATYGTVYGLLLLALSGGQTWSVVVCLGVILARLAQALTTLWCLACPRLFRWLWALPLRDLLSLFIWIGGAFGRRVYWRGRFLSVGTGGHLRELASRTPAPPPADKKVQFWRKKALHPKAIWSLFMGH